MIRFIAIGDKDMANGMRDNSKMPLTEAEIEYVKSEIKRIEANEALFVFNDPDHICGSTCYNYMEDKICVTRNVFPETKYYSAHPRDIMSVGAVLAHEYYGHRMYRDEYLFDKEQGKDYHTTPFWQDECRASITAAKIAPNLTQADRANLIMDAAYRAKEYGQLIKMDDQMKEIIYGYSSSEKNISRSITPIHYVSEASAARNEGEGLCVGSMSKMQKSPKRHNDYER